MKKNYFTLFVILFIVGFYQIFAQNDDSFTLRVNSGGSETTYKGETFITDAYFSTGSTLDRPQTGLEEPYQSFRFSRSQQMSYDIPVPDGEYIVNLYFAELWFGATGGGSGGVGSRVFDVNIEGQLMEDNLDVFAEVGADAMLMKTYTVTVTGGVLNIGFDARDEVGGERHPIINGIEVLEEKKSDNLTIESFSQVRAPYGGDSGVGEFSLNDGDQITFRTEFGVFRGIVANPNENVESVFYEYVNEEGIPETKVVNAPFHFEDWINTSTEVGVYSITATPYSEPDKGGEVGTPVTISYEIIEDLVISELYAVRSSNGASTIFEEITYLPNGDYKDGEDYSKTVDEQVFSGIAPIISSNIKSLRFGIHGPDGNVEVKTLHGEFPVLNMDKIGRYDIYITPFSEENLGGIAGFTYYYRFNIVDQCEGSGCEDPNNFALRINSGGSETSYNGETFITDAYFSSGSTLDRPQTGLEEPHQSFRFSRSQQMSYDIPVPDGEYIVNLYFAELWFGATGGGSGGVGSRVFDVNIEGVLAEDNLDVFAEVGADAMLMKTYGVTVTGGILNIDFDSRDEVGGERHPIVNAIEILGEVVEPEQRPFIFSITQAAGYNMLTFTIPIDQQYQYNYSVDWGDGNSNENVTEDVSHTYSSEGTYVVKISGDFPRPMFNESSNFIANNIYEILQWGDQKWKNLEGAFQNTHLLRLEANDIPDLSECFSIRNLFRNSGMSGSGMALIPQWNIGQFTDLSGLFHGTNFNEDISHWDVSHVTDMSYMFSSGTLGNGDSPGPMGGAFNQDISSWDVSNVTNMEGMFNGSLFNQDISVWNISGVTNMSGLFADSKFNKDISNWDVSHVTDMSYMFSGMNLGEIDRFPRGPDFNHPLNDWDVSNVTDMSGMFSGANNFNQDIGDWNVSNVIDMKFMFYAARNFNQDIGDWNVSSVTNMRAMFSNGFIYENSDQYIFNQDITGWDVSNVTNMSGMFNETEAFNQNIGVWDVSNVINMSEMFNRAEVFNQDIGVWDVGNVVNMSSMFKKTKNFNQDIGDWNVSNVTNMYSMFTEAESFNHSLGDWDISNLKGSKYSWSFDSMKNMFTNSGLSNENYDDTLTGWSQLPSLQNGVTLDSSSKYCKSEVARQYIIDTYGWTINDDGKTESCDNVTDFALRINTGSSEITYNGETFITDTYFNTGNTLDRPQTGLPEPYQSFRYSPSQQMSYDIPVPDGEYTVNLYFAELWFGATGGGSGGVGSRVFDVNIEGALAEDNLDVFAEVGADAMLMKNHVVTVTDGILNIAFDSRDEVGGKRHPIINAIEVISSSNGDSIPPMVTSIATEDITENSFKVDWMLNEASTGKVLWGTSDAALDNATTFEPNFLTHHIQTVSGLNANTTYYYSVVGEDEAGNSFVGEIQTVKTLEDITAQRPFIFSVKRNEGVGLEPISSVRIPIDPNLTYNYTVDWGDGYMDENVTTEITHDYGESVTQTYKIKITGIFPRPYFGVDREYRHYRFIELYQWGDIEWISLEQAFEITHLEYSALDVPDLSECSSLKNMFKNSLMTGEESHSLSNWEVGAITDMSGMFEGTIFNQDISSWDVGNVTNMSNMFAGSVKFHDNNSQFIASHFNKDISNWDVSNVTNMSGMFSFDGAFSNENYDKMLIGWSQLPSLQNGIRLDTPQNQYCKSKVARQYIIDTYGWTINDAGKTESCDNVTDFALRINTGSSETNYNGETFITDTYFNTGNTLDRPQTGLPEPYQSFRYSPSQQMSYDIPVPDGEYTVNLYFAELWFGATGGGAGGVGSRVFDVNIEGQLAEDNLDVFAQVGADAMLVKTHTVIVTGGVLNIEFDSRDIVGGERHPVINAIEVLSINNQTSNNQFFAAKGVGADIIGLNNVEMQLFPNPAQEHTTVSFSSAITIDVITVFDIHGRLIQTISGNHALQGNSYDVNVSTLQPGLYIIKVLDVEGVSYEKQLIVK